MHQDNLTLRLQAQICKPHDIRLNVLLQHKPSFATIHTPLALHNVQSLPATQTPCSRLTIYYPQEVLYSFFMQIPPPNPSDIPKPLFASHTPPSLPPHFNLKPLVLKQGLQIEHTLHIIQSNTSDQQLGDNLFGPTAHCDNYIN